MPHTDMERQHYGVTLAVLTTAALAYALLQTMIAPALPAIQHDLGVSTTSVTWVLTIYLLSASIATPVIGRLGDMFGKERMLVLVLVLFSAGCLVSALAHSLGLLIAGRAIQGAAGAVFPLAIGIIRDEFPRERVAAGIGLLSATFGIGGGIGLVLAGVLVDQLSWEWIFWFGLVLSLGATLATHLFVPESPVKTPGRVDVPGAILLSGGLSALLLAVSQGNAWGWGSGRIMGLFALSAVLFGVWARFELRVPQPLVDVRLLRDRGVWTTNLTGLLVGFGMFGSYLLIPQLVQTSPEAGYGFGASVTEAGLFLLPSAAVMLFAGPLAGVLGNRVGSKTPLLLGIAICAAGFALLAVVHDARWEIYAGSALMGLGIGMSFASMANLIVEAVPQTKTGEATGMNTIMRTVGGALGAQIAASIVSGHLLASGIPKESGYSEAFAVSAAAMLLAGLAALLIPRRPAAEVARVPAPPVSRRAAAAAR
jgi:EmrB/QacA subfamily drug resistance transporter